MTITNQQFADLLDKFGSAWVSSGSASGIFVKAVADEIRTLPTKTYEVPPAQNSNFVTGEDVLRNVISLANEKYAKLKGPEDGDPRWTVGVGQTEDETLAANAACALDYLKDILP